MPQRTVEHGNFVIERRFDAVPSLVFRAMTNIDMKRRWFAEGDGWVTENYVLDASEGGREEGTFRRQDGPPIRNETTYLDVVKDRRLVFSYCMFIDGKRISASLASIELLPDGRARSSSIPSRRRSSTAPTRSRAARTAASSFSTHWAASSYASPRELNNRRKT